MKFVHRVLGFLLVLVVLAFAGLFFADAHNWLGDSEFAGFVREMHIEYEDVKEIVTRFFKDSGIAEDAADLMDKGAQKLREGSDETAADTATAVPAATPEPSPAGTNTPIVFEVVTPKPKS